MSLNFKFETSEGGSDGDYVLLDDGAYTATLQNVKPTEMPDYNDNTIMNKAIEFTWKIEGYGPDPAFVKRTDKLMISGFEGSSGMKSNLYKDLRGMFGSALTPELAKDNEKLNKMIAECVGKEFLVMVEQRTSKAGNKYNKFISVSKLAGQKTDADKLQELSDKASDPVDTSDWKDEELPF